MSSAVPSAVPLASGANQRYFCHQCNRTVTIESPAGIELVCPICNGGFIEEFDLPSPSPVPSPPFFSLNSSAPPLFSSASPSPVFLSRSASFDLRNPTDIFSIIGTDPNLFRSTSTSSESAIFPSPSTTSDTGFFPSSSAGSDAFNPLDFLQRYIQTLLNDGANIQIVLEDGDRPIGNLGDYFFGPGLEQLIQQLAENDPNRYGTPPAAKSSIAVLPDVKITEDLLASDEAQCAVCKEVFEIGEEAKQMPCKHIFHKDCILPWLDLHNSCPVCRYELPTDDPDYEQRRCARNPSPTTAVGMESAVSGGSIGTLAGSMDQNVLGQRPAPVERRFRISLPWPFRGLGFQAEGSAGDMQGNEGNGGGNDETSGGQGASRTDARQGGLELVRLQVQVQQYCWCVTVGKDLILYPFKCRSDSQLCTFLMQPFITASSLDRLFKRTFQ